MSSDSLHRAPHPENVEVHVFGPGYGESLLIHTGKNRWIIVDSCKKSSKSSPAAIEWLHQIGVDPSQAVTHVVATHWHDDHVRGLGETLEQCAAATFVCSSALLSRELIALFEDAAQPLQAHSSGVDEIRRVVAELTRRRANSSAKLVGLGIEYAKANTRIVHDEGLPSCEVWALSPSSAEIELSLREFVKMLDDSPKNRAKPVVRPTKPNDTAVVLWIKIGERILLLGADLEERRSSPRSNATADCGWTAILTSGSRPKYEAEIFKVTHHGSETGHHDEIWSTLLRPTPLSLMTPFVRGKCRLPNDDDKSRILALSGEAYISARPQPKKYKPKDRVVAWAYQGKNPTVPAAMGHIVARASALDATCPWDIQLLEGALPLAEA